LLKCSIFKTIKLLPQMKLDLTKPSRHTTSLPLPPPSTFLSTTALIPHYPPPPATKNPLQRSFFFMNPLQRTNLCHETPLPLNQPDQHQHLYPQNNETRNQNQKTKHKSSIPLQNHLNIKETIVHLLVKDRWNFLI
jgi:hypothetical protein